MWASSAGRLMVLLVVAHTSCRSHSKLQQATARAQATSSTSAPTASGAAADQPPPVEGQAADDASQPVTSSAAPPGAVRRIILGDGWGCAEVDGNDDTAHQYCWTTPNSSSSATASNLPVVAKRISWLGVSALADYDRLCVRDGQSVKCWAAREFLEAAPADLPERKAWRAQGKQTRFATGIWASNHFACSLEADVLSCTGNDEFGQLASGHPPRAGDGVDWHTVALGRWHACSSLDFDVDCWGRADYGQLGAQATSTCRAEGREIPCSRTPLRVKGPKHELEGVPQLFAGDLFTCAMWSDFVECWGANRDGFFGTPGACDTTLTTNWPTAGGAVAAPRAACSRTPVRVGSLRVRHPSSWSAGPRGLCVDDMDGTSSCVGAIQAARGVSPIVVSSADDASACGVSSNRLVCWGAQYSPSEAANRKVELRFEQPARTLSVPVFDRKASWDPSCMIHRACARDVEAIPRCRPGEESQDWAKLASHAAEYRGQVVNVRGTLASGLTSSTLIGCSRTLDKVDPDPSRLCCNTVYAPVVLAATRDPLLLEWLDCRGDESRSCCNVPELGGEVVASGKLESSDEGRSGGWILRQPELCWR